MVSADFVTTAVLALYQHIDYVASLSSLCVRSKNRTRMGRGKGCCSGEQEPLPEMLPLVPLCGTESGRGDLVRILPIVYRAWCTCSPGLAFSEIFEVPWNQDAELAEDMTQERAGQILSQYRFFPVRCTYDFLAGVEPALTEACMQEVRRSVLYEVFARAKRLDLIYFSLLSASPPWLSDHLSDRPWIASLFNRPADPSWNLHSERKVLTQIAGKMLPFDFVTSVVSHRNIGLFV